jgi:hypothetical protein
MRYSVPLPSILWSMVLLLVSSGCYAQTVQSSAAPTQIQYLRFILMNIASLDHAQEATDHFEALLVKQFGLTTQDSAAIHGAAMTLRSSLVQIRKSSQSVAGGSAALSSNSAATLNSFANQREQLISTLSSQVLSALAPATAARLTAAGNLVTNHPASLMGARQ